MVLQMHLPKYLIMSGLHVFKNNPLKIDTIVILPCYTQGKCAKYETCAKLHMFHSLYITVNPLPHMLYFEHCIISINNSNFQIFSKIFFYI